jgi:hypothetical protein
MSALRCQHAGCLLIERKPDRKVDGLVNAGYHSEDHNKTACKCAALRCHNASCLHDDASLAVMLDGFEDASCFEHRNKCLRFFSAALSAKPAACSRGAS